MTTQTAASAAPASTNTTGMLTLSDALAYLISYRVNDFYARFMSSMPLRALKKLGSMGDKFMMGVTFENGHHVLLYNPDWVEKKLAEGRKGFDELRATIAHEAMHVILLHIARQMKLYKELSFVMEKERFARRTNIAADMAVNDLLVKETDTVRGSGLAYRDFQDNKAMWVFPETFQLPEGMDYEWYMTLLMDPKACPPKCQGGQGCGGSCGNKPQRGKGKGDGPPDIDGEGGTVHHPGAHEQWLEMAESMTPEEMDVLLTQMEQDSYEKLKQTVAEHKRGRGTVPGHIEERLEAMLKPPEVPWKRLLHQFVSKCRKSKPTRSMQRPRKRWMNLGSTLFPGVFRDPSFRLMFAIDTSGSMSGDQLLEGLSELQGIQRVDKDTEVVVVEFDTEIHKEYVLDSKGKPDVNLRGRGGTDFNKAFERAMELSKKQEIDALVVFTDGYAPAPELEFRPVGLPVLWCLTDGGVHPAGDYGMEIRRPKERRW